jgi:hypothetical protein
VDVYKIFYLNKKFYIHPRLYQARGISAHEATHDPNSPFKYFDSIFYKCPVAKFDLSDMPKWSEPDSMKKFSMYQEIPNMDKMILDGYFQNEKYFEEYRDKILELFEPKKEHIDSLISTYTKVENSFFIHVRIDLQAIFLFDLTNYLIKCIEHIQKHYQLNEIHFYIISDNLDKTRYTYGNIFNSLPNKTYVNDNEINSFYLMTLCKLGGICWNSTFSWWGAYLNNNSNKLIYMPSKWIDPNITTMIDVYSKNSILIY